MVHWFEVLTTEGYVHKTLSFGRWGLVITGLSWQCQVKETELLNIYFFQNNDSNTLSTQLKYFAR